MLENYKKIAECKNFGELDIVLDEIGNIEGSRSKVYTAEENKGRIKMVREGYPLNYVTRGLGLRAKVAELYWYQTHGIEV